MRRSRQATAFTGAKMDGSAPWQCGGSGCMSSTDGDLRDNDCRYRFLLPRCPAPCTWRATNLSRRAGPRDRRQGSPPSAAVRSPATRPPAPQQLSMLARGVHDHCRSRGIQDEGAKQNVAFLAMLFFSGGCSTAEEIQSRLRTSDMRWLQPPGWHFPICIRRSFLAEPWSPRKLVSKTTA